MALIRSSGLNPNASVLSSSSTTITGMVGDAKIYSDNLKFFELQLENQMKDKDRDIIMELKAKVEEKKEADKFEEKFRDSSEDYELFQEKNEDLEENKKRLVSSQQALLLENEKVYRRNESLSEEKGETQKQLEDEREARECSGSFAQLKAELSKRKKALSGSNVKLSHS